MKQKNKNCINKKISLDFDTSNIFIAKNAKNHAFIEQFNYSSVNFTQKKLGSILGFFVVRNTAETSENIVNFLASEIKKKYFSPINQNAEEKLELTLHHINRALEELANIGNIEWLGQIDGAVCAIDTTTIHFSVTGNAHILLLRDNSLINISKDLAPVEATEQPLKTFVDISSGDLCPNDKIIITSQELLDLVSFDELQKNAINFGQENFIQFIKTVLTNECSLATTTIIDIYEKIQSELHLEQQTITEIPSNIFGATAFEKKPDQILTNTDLKSPEKKPAEYTDPRTGHIHIQGNNEPLPKQTFIEILQERSLELFDDAKEFTITNWHIFFRKLSNRKKQKSLSSTQNSDTLNDFEEFDDIPETILANTTTTKESKIKEITIKFFRIAFYKIRQIKQISYSIVKNISNKIFLDKKKSINLSEMPIKQKISFLPSIHHITKLWHKMSTITKLTAIGILIFIIIIPLIFAKIFHKDENSVTNTSNSNIQQNENHALENIQANTTKNITQNNINDPIALLTEPSIISTVLINKKTVGITKNAVILLSDKKKEDYSIPTDSGEIALATPMSDLDLIFILTTKNKLYSFSPLTKKFIQQKNIPKFNYSEILQLNTYMTYIYTLNIGSIKRYARIENGFDTGKLWLKEKTTFSKKSSLAIDDNIYIIQDNQLLKFNKGKKEPFSLDSSIQKISYIYTTKTTKFMWLLDTTNNILFKINKKTGQKINNYTNSQFHDATSLIIDEQKNKVIISTTKNILSFDLKND